MRWARSPVAPKMVRRVAGEAGTASSDREVHKRTARVSGDADTYDCIRTVRRDDVRGGDVSRRHRGTKQRQEGVSAGVRFRPENP